MQRMFKIKEIDCTKNVPSDGQDSCPISKMLDNDVVGSREEGCDLDGFQNPTYRIWIGVLFE